MDPRWTNRVARFGVAFTIVLVALWGATIVWALTSASARGAEIALDGGRAYTLHAPANAGGAPRPLVVMLHGGGGEPVSTARATGWSRKADDAGFVVAYGRALPLDPTRRPRFAGNPPIWNDGSNLRALAPKPDDVAYVAAVIDDVARRVAIDRARIYLSGWSNGAAMALLAAQALGERVAAIAVFGGNSWSDGVALVAPVSLLYVVGERDPLTPPAGGTVRRPGGGPATKPPTRDAALAWAGALGCPAMSEPGERWRWRTERWAGCARGGEVIYAIVPGHGHNWPGAAAVLPERVMGPTAPSLRAEDAMWEFLAAHRR